MKRHIDISTFDNRQRIEIIATIIRMYCDKFIVANEYVCEHIIKQYPHFKPVDYTVKSTPNVSEPGVNLIGHMFGVSINTDNFIDTNAIILDGSLRIEIVTTEEEAKLLSNNKTNWVSIDVILKHVKYE